VSQRPGKNRRDLDHDRDGPPEVRQQLEEGIASLLGKIIWPVLSQTVLGLTGRQSLLPEAQTLQLILKREIFGR
jgi:hypothetical protein